MLGLVLAGHIYASQEALVSIRAINKRWAGSG